MVVFNELRISDDKESIVIDCHIQDVSYYTEMYINGIYLEYYKDFSDARALGERAYTVYEKGDGDAMTYIRRIVQLDDLQYKTGVGSLEGALFYVVVDCDGELPQDIIQYGAWASTTTDVGVLFDWEMLYHRGIQHIASYYYQDKMCGDTSGLQEFILLWNALRLAIQTGDWPLVNTLWDKVHSFSIMGGTASPCKCGQ